MGSSSISAKPSTKRKEVTKVRTAEISVWRNPKEKCWEVRVIVAGKRFGRLFYYKKDAQEYAELIKDPKVLNVHLYDALRPID
jgi:hypothetical protein